MPSLVAAPSKGLAGCLAVPGDKSMSHRAVILGSLAIGTTRVRGLLEGADVLHTADAMRALGATVTRHPDGVWEVRGVGVGGLREAGRVIDMGNSGTAVRLLMGLVASQDIATIFTGDASLTRRPMERVMAPLRQMGTRFEASQGGRLPLTVVGCGDPLPITYRTPVPSAQVKSAVMLAALNTPGTTMVIEREATRDHTERMLRHFGVPVLSEEGPEGITISLTGPAELTARDLVVPGDISSAAFPIVAALVSQGSDVVIENVGMNGLRTGIVTSLLEMGADITLLDEREESGEPVADLRVRAGRLKGMEIPPERAPSMIDEYPVLAVAAAFAEGTTRMTGLGELRVKESDRLMATARMLRQAGVQVEEGDDWMAVTGGPVAGGGLVKTFMDHRIAMAGLVLGLGSARGMTIDDDEMIDTSFPGFATLMAGIGAGIGEAAA
jgi:3-phosphoshikimate 1-carboxyvinyltransferase